MIYFIDTNIFLRVLIKEDEKIFRECFEFLKLVKQKKISGYTSSLILAEINWTLSSFYNFKKSEVIEALKSILNLKNLKIIDKFNSKIAINLYERNSVKFIDAVIASIPEISTGKIIVVSYDRDFDKLKIKRIEPGVIVEGKNG